jgi:hypothetical protein
MKSRIRFIITFLSLTIFAGCSGPYVVIEYRSTIDCLFTESFNAVTSLIKLNQEEIQNVSFAGEWLQGKYYDITYRANIGTVYCDNSKQVESISFSDVKIYQKGLISLDVNDYLVNTTKSDELYSNAIQRVKSELKFPKEAVFKSQSFGFARWRNFYGVSGVVEAKNALGIKTDLKFSLIYDVSAGNKLVHFVLNGENIFGAKPNIEPQREEIENEESKDIVLVDGLKGNFGKEVTLDGTSYIWFIVPEGKYEITCESKSCIVFLDKDKTIKNSDGYTETVNVFTLRLNQSEKSAEFHIGRDQHLELGIGTNVRLRVLE